MELKQKVLKGELAIYCNSKTEAEAMCKVEKLPLKGRKYSKIFCFFYMEKDRCLFVSKNYVSNNNIPTTTAKKFLASVNDAPQRKIIGYYAPINLYGGSVKKGDLLTNTVGNAFSINNTPARFFFPKEIVETWQPVFSEKIDDYVIERGCDYIIISGIKYPISFLKKLVM